MSWYEDENPNKVTRGHFELAIKLAEECKPERPDKIAPKVGAVVVKDGEVISNAHRNQIGSGDHAEFIALEQRAVDKVDFVGADLITTLEPCTEKRHGKEKKACAEWVKLRRIRKVWVGLLDRNPHIRGKTIMRFHDWGIHVGWFPDDLVPRILAQNKEFFDFARLMTPKLTTDELEGRRAEVQNLALHELASYRGDSKRFPSESELLQLPIDSIEKALSLLATIDLHEADGWAKVGSRLLLAHIAGTLVFEGQEGLPLRSEMIAAILEGGSEIDARGPLSDSISGNPPAIAPAGRAFDTALHIDGTHVESIIGKTTVDLLIGEVEEAKEFLDSVRRHIPSPNEKVVYLYRNIASQLESSDLPGRSSAYHWAKKFE